MKPDTRLWVAALLIVGSSLYALLVVKDPSIASAVATGYVALFLSVFALINLWKSP